MVVPEEPAPVNPVNPSEPLKLPPTDAVVEESPLLHSISLQDSAVSRAEKIESNGVDATNNTDVTAKRSAECIAGGTPPAKRVKGVAPIKAEYFS